MTPRRLLTALFTALAVLAAPAAATPAKVSNACQYKFDGYWRTLDLTTDGVAGPNPVAHGGTIGLTQSTIHADMPTWIGDYGYNLGLLKEGRNEIPTRIWVAIGGTATTPGVQVHELAATAVTHITVQPDGTPKSTPISVTVPIPDTSWQAGADGVAAFAQAGPGTLPEIPVGPSGALVKPTGSVFISAQLEGGLHYDLDCQPGHAMSTGSGSETFTAGTATPFAATGIGVPVAPPRVDPNAKRPAAIRSTKLRRSGRHVKVRVACLTTTACAGKLELVTAGRVRVGKRRRVLALASRSYRIAPRSAANVQLTLRSAARRFLKGRKRTSVRLRVVPGTGQKVSKRLALRGR